MPNLLNNLELHAVSRETLALVDELLLLHASMLNEYVDRLLWWNRKVNLVSRDLNKDDVLLHVKHSLLPSSILLETEIPLWMDTGTGGGLPGIPLAIVCPEVHFILNDVVEKKGVVLKDIIGSLSLKNATVLIRDVAAIDIASPFGVLTKHAFKISDLLGRLNGKTWAELLMLKGSDYSSELIEVSDAPISVVATSLAQAIPNSFFDGKYLLRICPTRSTAVPDA